MRGSPQERFDAKYEIVEPGGCWVWMASLGSTGYGQISVSGLTDRAHRVSWRLFKGLIPDGLCVLHRCDVRCCVNPAHLFLGTYADNFADCVAKGRSARGERNGNAKLSESDVAGIRAVAGAMYQREIAAFFGVDRSWVSRVINGQSRRME